MGIAVSLLISAVGLILALAVHPHEARASVDPNTVGWILFVVGLVGARRSTCLLWSNYGPGYMRRTTVVDGGARVYPARRAARGTPPHGRRGRGGRSPPRRSSCRRRSSA